MAQLNLYVPDELATHLKQDARRAGLPLSRYVVSLLTVREDSGWPAGYFTKACGFLREEMAEPEDSLPEPLDFPEPRS